MVRVKVCGITSLRDAELSVEAGANLLGFNFWPGSKRHVSAADASKIIKALPTEVLAVGLFVNAPPEEVKRTAESSGFTIAQLHGEESLSPYESLGLELIQVIKLNSEQSAREAVRTVAPYVLVDSAVPGYGGAGTSFDWSWVDLVRERLSRNVFVAGGLTPENVGDLVRRVRPEGVDVASGVEAAPGRKDAQKLKAFVAAVRSAENT